MAQSQPSANELPTNPHNKENFEVSELKHEPKFYELPHHVQRIYDSPEFAKAAAEANRTVEQFRADVLHVLKDLGKEVRDAELREFERTLGAQALNAALEKFKADVASELKTAVAKARAAELK